MWPGAGPVTDGGTMNKIPRSPFQQKVVEALLESKAINIEAVGATMAQFGHDAMKSGEPLATIITRNVIWNCGYPGPFAVDDFAVPQINPGL